ncbi:hypothetical protein ABPG72_016108 [Tetrahymena utriculariae]
MGDYANMIDDNFFYFILQMTVSCTIFIFTWIAFFSYLKRQYLISKQALDVFDNEQLKNIKLILLDKIIYLLKVKTNLKRQQKNKEKSYLIKYQSQTDAQN